MNKEKIYIKAARLQKGARLPRKRKKTVKKALHSLIKKLNSIILSYNYREGDIFFVASTDKIRKNPIFEKTTTL